MITSFQNSRLSGGFHWCHLWSVFWYQKQTTAKGPVPNPSEIFKAIHLCVWPLIAMRLIWMEVVKQPFSMQRNWYHPTAPTETTIKHGCLGYQDDPKFGPHFCSNLLFWTQSLPQKFISVRSGIRTRPGIFCLAIDVWE